MTATDSRNVYPTNAGGDSNDAISLFALGTTLLKNRWRIAGWMFLGALVGVVPVISAPRVYRASASFIPSGYDGGRSGLAGLAGQFGVSVALPTGNQSLTPEFYTKLLKSRVLLQPLVDDTLVVAENGGRRMAFLDLFNVQGATSAIRQEQGLNRLIGLVSPSVSRTTGVVEVSVATIYPSVSLAIVKAVIERVNEYNQETRQGQAAAERQFVEGRLSVARVELREAEENLGRFLRTNRDLGGSPDLVMQRDRIQREVQLKQEIYTSLMKAYEDVRVREVRDTPVITIFEAPAVPSVPEPRGRFRRLLLGLMLGGFVGVFLAFAGSWMARRRSIGDPEAVEFAGMLGQLKRELLSPFRRLRRGASN